MTLINTLLVSHAGTAELAGAGFGAAVGFLLLSFAYGVLRAAKTRVSQAVGAGKHERIPAIQAAALCFALIAGITVLVLAELVSLIVPFITASADAGAATQLYLMVGMLASPLMIWNTALREVCFGQGDSRTAMISAVCSNVANIVFAAVLLFVFHTGVAGAALASIDAHLVDFVVTTWRAGKNCRITLTGGMKELPQLLQLGVPSGLQFCLEVGAFTLLSALVAGFGTHQMAAHQIALNIVQFCLMPINALAESGAVLAGQAIGARKRSLVYRVAHLVMIMASVYSIIWVVASLVAPGVIVSLFTGDAELMPLASGLLSLAAVFMLFDAGNIVARAILRSVKDVRIPALVGVVSAWCLTPPLTWYLGQHLGFGLQGGWLGLCCQTVAGTVFLWWRLERGGWEAAASLEEEPQT